MDILFCDRCHESIPDADLETGRAVRGGGKVLHVPCAFRRAMPGPGRTVVALLAVLAAAGAAYAVARVQTPAVASESKEMPAAWHSAVVDDLASRVGKDLEVARASITSDVKRDTQASVDRAVADLHDQLANEIKLAAAKLDGQVKGVTDAQLRRFESNEKRLEEVAEWVKEVRSLAARSAIPQPVPVDPSPAPPISIPGTPDVPPAGLAPSTSGDGRPPGPLDPESQRKHDEELKKWLEALKDPNAGIAFSATYKLKDLGDLRAAPALIDTLRAHKDYYTRLGAAVALGVLKSADAVPALIDALDDKEDLVQTSAADALTSVTGNDPKFVGGLTKKERKAIKEGWGKWWKDNEATVRQRLGQPGK